MTSRQMRTLSDVNGCESEDKINRQNPISGRRTNGHIRFLWKRLDEAHCSSSTSMENEISSSTKIAHSLFFFAATPSSAWFTCRCRFRFVDQTAHSAIFPLLEIIAKHVGGEVIIVESARSEIFLEFFSLSRNGFNHKCNWWINIVTWRGMAKVECTNHSAKVPHFICMHIFLRRRPHPRSFQSMTRSDFYRSRRRKSEEFFFIFSFIVNIFQWQIYEFHVCESSNIWSLLCW